MSFFRKARKLITKPGVFYRDALIKRHPVEKSTPQLVAARPGVNDRKLNPTPGQKPQKQKPVPTPAATKNFANPFSKFDDTEERIVFPTRIGLPFAIDFVFTWVDSNDQSFIDLYNEYAPEASHRDDVADAARFESSDELRYALRSVFEFAPWVRHVYIVTNGQVPSWLDLTHPKIKIVRHDQILDEQYLPTFNSHVIESALHNIPGISEHYVYFNDDMMLLRPIKPEYFFSASGLGYMFISSVTVPNAPKNHSYDNPTLWGAKNSRDLIYAEFGFYCDLMFAHTFYPQIKSVAKDCEQRWPAEFHTCRSNRFRADSDLFCTGFLFPHVAHITGRALFAKTRMYYFNIRKRTSLSYYKMLREKKGTTAVAFSMCPNDRSSADSENFPEFAKHLRRALDHYYPQLCAAEIPPIVEIMPEELPDVSSDIVLPSGRDEHSELDTSSAPDGDQDTPPTGDADQAEANDQGFQGGVVAAS